MTEEEKQEHNNYIKMLCEELTLTELSERIKELTSQANEIISDIFILNGELMKRYTEDKRH